MPPALAYELVTDELHGCGRVRWLGESGSSAATLLADPAAAEDRADRDEAADWLTAFLTERGCEAPAADAFKAARADGITERTLQRARARAGVTSQRRGFGKGAVWTLDPFTTHSRHSGHPLSADVNGANGGADGPDGNATGAGHDAVQPAADAPEPSRQDRASPPPAVTDSDQSGHGWLWPAGSVGEAARKSASGSGRQAC